MAENCTFHYFDPTGQPSREYEVNKVKYGKEAAHALFISNTLKTDISIRKSISFEESDKKLRTEYKSEDLSAKGYRGASSIINSVKDQELSMRIKSSMAIEIKVRQILAQKASENPEYIDILKNVKDEYFVNAEDAKNFKVKPQHQGEFNALIKDAETLIDLQTTKGTQMHELLKEIWIAKNDALKSGDTNFNSYFKTAKTAYKNSIANKANPMSESMMSSIESIAKDIETVAKEYNKKWGVDDIELLPEVSIFSDNIKFNGSPMQGHIDLLIYSPSLKKCVVIDYKTKSEKSFANFEKSYKKMKPPFDDLREGAENSTAIQTGIYSIMLKEEYGLDVDDNKVVLITTRISEEGPSTEQVDGEREWRIAEVLHPKVVIKSLTSMDGLLRSEKIFDIKEPATLGKKTSDQLISELFDGKLVTSIGSKENFINSQEPHIKVKPDGKFNWFNASDSSKSITKETKEEVRDGIGKWYDELMDAKEKAASHLVYYFNKKEFPEGSIWKSPRYRALGPELLKRFTKNSYDLNSHLEIPGIGKDIIIAKNKINGEVTLISVSAIFKSDYLFSESADEKAKSTIFGKIIDDVTANKKFKKNSIPAADTHSLTHLKLAMLAAELKIRDPKKYSAINTVLSVTMLDDKPFSYSNIKTQMGYLKQMTKLMKDNELPIPSELEKISTNQDLSGNSAFEVDHFLLFIKAISNGIDPLKILIDEKVNINTIAARELRKKLINSIEIYQQDRFNHVNFNKIELELAKYVQTVFGALQTENKTSEEVMRDPRFVAANRAWLAFKNWMVLDNTSIKDNALIKFNSLTSIGDKSAENVQSAINEYTQKSRDEIISIINEHQLLQKELIRESKDISLMDQILNSKNYQKLFDPMMADGFKFNEDNVDGWMQFKDPDDVKNNLTDTQRKYIRFYAKMVRMMAEKLFPHQIPLMYGTIDSDVYAIKKWGKYNIPIIPNIGGADFSDSILGLSSVDAIISKLSVVSKNGNSVVTLASQDDSEPWKFNSIFPEQVDSSQGKGSRQTRNLLNITDTNQVIETKRNVELNPIVVLNLMVVEAARMEYMKLAKFASFSVNAELVYKDLYAGVDSTALRDVIKDCAQLQLEGTPKSENLFDRSLDKIKKITQMGLFWGSGSQVITEGGTALFQVTSQSAANIINKYILGGENRYDNKDMLWSNKHLMTSFGSQIIADTGMYNSGLGDFTDTQFNELAKKLAMQTKHGFWFIHTTLKQAVQSIVLAQMHKEGITEKCFKLNEITGRYEYDENLDSRFYVYDPNDPKFQQNKEPKSDDEKRRNEFWLAHKETMVQEGGLDKDGKMKRPFINKQYQTMKHHSIRLLGSMDSSELTAVEIAAVGRAFTTFKRWMRQKVTNYVGTQGGDKTYKEGRWGLDADGKYTWIEEEFEGMFQAFGGIIRDLMKHGNLSESSDVRKRQASKLLADALLGSIIIYLALMLKDAAAEAIKETKFDGGQSGGGGAGSSWGLVQAEIARGVYNAASDIFPVAAVGNLITKGPMAAVSVVFNASKSILQGVGSAVTGDLDNAISSTDKALSASGLYRSGKAMTDAMFDFEISKK